ncbi:oxidoreductase [uncultured Bacteroides sp.]|uniref:oxidoreductase n=1 Tax=uncultured Bacteroides sp. TaxID=162156 RepID=UPI002AA61B26|nr:oxidoreductase [uncultured Bacteroides sp.]
MMEFNSLSGNALSMQKPIGSGFTGASTADDVIKGIDLTNKIAIVTGGYSGLGLETVRVLHAAGARVVVPTRDLSKAENALKNLEGVEIEMMDLMNPASIDSFAEKFLASGRPLHILVNSAGIMACPLARDARGYESQFATNHLGHFQLVARLWPALCRAKGARVVSVSSWGHHYSPIVFEDPNFEHRDYDRWMAYGQSKTANILFALSLDKLGREEGIRAFSLHPGSILNTGLGKHLSDEELRNAGVIDELRNPILDPARNLKTVEQGAATSVWCATSPQLNDMGGVYCENGDIAPLVAEGDMSSWNLGDSTRHTGVMFYAVDTEQADRLWKLSEKLIGVTIK